MMASCKITLWGFNSYLKNNNDDLFKQLSLPEGIDKEVLIDNILLRSNDFELLYSEPYFMQEAIGTWSKKWYRTFDKWIKALNITYNPLENYDRMEEWTTTDDGHTSSSGTSTDTSNGTGSSSTENKISAFNSETYSNDNTNTTNTSNSTSGTTTLNNTGASDNTNVRVGRAHGNIGVTTSQQMLESELDIARWNIYEHITDIFLSEFIIPIY